MNQFHSDNPRKSYKRIRFKWLLFFIVIGVLIIWTGVNCTKEKNGENSQVPAEDFSDTSVPVEEINHLPYLQDSPDIRVILQAGNYAGLYHAKAELTFPSGGYILTCENNHWEKHAVERNKSVTIGIGDEYDFCITQDVLVAAIPATEEDVIIVENIDRNREVCSYYGRLEITLEAAGIMIVNALSLETYLCGVVPSEMPAGYEKEALRAQAILARTYAYKYLIQPAFPEVGAHVDDSIAFQVYGNINAHEATSKAVADTKGTLLFSDKALAEVYYYSTSCGYGTDGTAWGGEGKNYLQAKRIGAGTLQSANGTLKGAEAEIYYMEKLKEEQVFQNMIRAPFTDGYEAEEGWYRWSAEGVSVDGTALLQRMQERYAANPNVVLTQNKKGEFVSKNVKSLGDIKNITIAERGAGGVVKSLIIGGSENTYKIMLEYNIRYVLNGSGTTVTKADGTTAYCKTLLPSGFFFLDTVHLGQNVISYNLYGGGYGHGVGMSQNGANRMAMAGLSCQDILTFFFPETVLVSYEK